MVEHLWAGWRSDYVASVPDDDAVDHSEAECVFCRILGSGAPDEETFVVHRGERCVAILNVYPYGTGHLMVLPRRHVAALSALQPDEGAEVWANVADAVAVLGGVYRPDGFNVGLNLGRTAGAGIPGHLHVHVVPRWGADTNFMTSVANTRVMPEALDVTWSKVTEGWAGARGRR